MVDPRTPVIVGVGQCSQRPDDPAEALEPVDLLAEAARIADADAGVSLIAKVDTIAVTEMLSWRYPDPAALLGRRLGTEPARTILSTVGGNSAQMLITECSQAIRDRTQDIALVGGVECMASRQRARREPKTWLGWSNPDDPPCPDVRGNPAAGSTDDEMAHLAAAPVQVYPLFETALRARAGRDVDAHQGHVASLWARLAAVAAENPHAWSRAAWSPEEIATVTPDNRMVTFPYTKRMCAHLGVDQAAAIVLCSYEAARAAGVAEDRMVFPHAASASQEHYFISERDSLGAAPALGVALHHALDGASIGVDDVARFDLYSCFPSAVQLAADQLGIATHDPRPLSVTGGLAFAGGPGNSYVNHSVASMVEACRADPGSFGLVTGVGWYMTKHAVGVYSTIPSPEGFVRADPEAVRAEVEAMPARRPAGPYDGPAILEATAVIYDRDQAPSVAIVAALTPDGRRAFANARDRDALADMITTPWEGREVRLATDGTTNTLAS